MTYSSNPPWDDDWPKEGEFLAKYRSSLGKYVYHLTDRENAASIREQGILHDAPSDGDTERISTALAEHGLLNRLPIDREEVVYCHLDGGYVAERLREQHENDLFANNKVAVVVDFEAIDAPTYLANMSVITDVIEHDVVPEEHEEVIPTDTIEEAVSLYEESIERVESPVDIFTHPRMFDGALELIVDGDVSSSAIVDICDYAIVEEKIGS